MDAPAGEALDQRGQALAGGVDGVGAHRIAHIIDQVQHQERSDGRFVDQAHLQIARPAAQPAQHRVDFCRFRQQERLVLEQGASGQPAGRPASSTCI